MKNLLLSILLISALLVPNFAQAVEQQPPGQFPITQPLQPIQPGVKPNYSGSVQHQGSSSPAQTEANTDYNQNNSNAVSPNTTDSGAPTVLFKDPRPVEQSSSKFWIFIVIGLVIVVAIGIYLWKKKVIKNMTTFVIAFAIFSSVLFGIHGLKIALAQSLPKNGPPIQRTIEVEGEQNSISPSAQPQSQNQGLYGILAVGLGLLAVGAIYLLWTKYPIKNISNKP